MAIFDFKIQIALHGGAIAKDRAGTKRARAELHPTLKPAEGLLLGYSVGHCVYHGFFAIDLETCPRGR